jgi:hypothetical protein
MLPKIYVIVAVLLFAGVPANANKAPSQEADKAQGDKPAAKEQEKEYPDFKEVTKDMEELEGLFTLWYYPDSAKGKDKEKLLCQVPSGFLGQMFMLSTSFSGGGFYTGFPLDERAVKWEEFNRNLLLIEPQTRFVVDDKSTVSDVVRRTHPDKILAALPIVTKSPGGDPVIDLGPLLKSDFANIGWTTRYGFGGSGEQEIEPQLSRWVKKKAFPSNVEICVELAISQENPPGSFSKKLVHYSFWELKKTDYQPRIADDRVGYFLTTNRDWSKPTDERDIFNRYIDRWNLKKRDPSLELCEPVKPIVFYIEKTVPVRFRRAIRDGILEWNKAFEKVGFLNAIQVRQQTEDNEWRDLDPEDMRYSFFRWIVTGYGFAMGPHRANPFTGEIYDADIVFDDSMVRYFERSAERMLPSSAIAMKTNHPALQAFFREFPQWQGPLQGWMNCGGHHDDETKFIEAMNQRAFESRYSCCDYIEGMKHQMAVAGAVLSGQPKEVLERFLYDVIKETACHEVGHTLGLRHNFAASSIYSLDEIKNRRATEQATSGSIMDYNPVLFFKDKCTEGHFVTPTIGPYDYWAIEYGYRPYDEKYTAELEKKTSSGKSDKPKDKDKCEDPNEAYLARLSGEAKMLHLIASRSAEPELLYLTDEDTVWVLSPDPRSNRFDMGADPVDWAQSRMDLIDQRMSNLLQWGTKKGESWYHARSAFIRLLFEKTIVLDHIGRYAGGQYYYRSHRADPNAPAPFEVVPASLQRRALNFVADNLFEDEFFTFSPELLNHMAPPRWWHDGTSINLEFFIVDLPIHDYIAVMQWWHLIDRLYPLTLRRIHDNEMKTSDAQKLTAAEYLQTIQKAVWKDTCDAGCAGKGQWSDNKPFVSDVRRSLQREYLYIMELLVRIRPGRVISPDLHAMVWCSLDELGKSIDEVLKEPSLDFASRAHLKTCRSRIERMLTTELQEW